MSNQDLEKYYEVLEVDNDASREEITRAYNHLKNLYTTGSMAIEPIDNEWDEEDKQDILQKVEEAYEILLPLAPEEEPIEEEPEETPPFEEEIVEEETIEEALPVEEEFIEEQGPVEAEPAVGPPVVVEEYANHTHHDVHEVHIELDDDVSSDAVPHHEEENQLFDISEMEEEPELEPELELGLEPEALVLEEEVEEEVDTLAEEFIDPGPVSGNTFREMREARGLGFEELSESTQIPTEMLEYIEDENFEQLPDAGYLRWYITTYAKTLSIDPKECADEYMKRYREWKKNER